MINKWEELGLRLRRINGARLLEVMLLVAEIVDAEEEAAQALIAVRRHLTSSRSKVKDRSGRPTI